MVDRQLVGGLMVGWRHSLNDFGRSQAEEGMLQPGDPAEPPLIDTPVSVAYTQGSAANANILCRALSSDS